MKLPFDAEQFFAVFARYNEAVWPAQAVLTGLAVVAALLAWRPSPTGDRVISGILAALWAWMGIVYHYSFFRAINPAAALFAAAFVLQAVLFIAVGVIGGRLRFRVNAGASGLAAGILIVYALVVYPLVGQSAGHLYPAAPTFGVPCPTTIFTLGMLVAALPHVPKTVLLVPLAWAAVGTVAALELGVPQDFGLPVAGLIAVGFTVAVPRTHAGGTMRRIAIALALFVAGAATLTAQSTTKKPEIRPFIGANVPTGEQRNLFTDAALLGAQIALELRPTVHVVGTFGWAASQTSYNIPDDNVNMFTYDVGVEMSLVQSLGGAWELKPFVGLGAGARTYAYSGDLPDQTCGSAYLGGGTEFQLVPWAFRLEARYNAFCYQTPFTTDESETRYDLGLTLGLAYHFR